MTCINMDGNNMKSVEELKSEIEKREKIVKQSYSTICALKNELRVRSEKTTKDYFHKFIKFGKKGYYTYMYVEGADPDYDDGWMLQGHGYRTCDREDGTVQFETICPAISGCCLSNVDKGYDDIAIITATEFYDTREKVLNEIMSETYDK